MIFLGKEYTIKPWSGKYLGDYVTIDTETEMVKHAEVPALVLFQAYGDLEPNTVYLIDDVMGFMNKHRSCNFIFHNAAFDVRVIEEHTGHKFYDIYDDGRIWDTALLYRLLHLAIVGEVPFKWNLALLAKKYLNITLEKDDDIRTTFTKDNITQEHIEYACKDVIATHLIFKHLIAEVLKQPTKTYLSHPIQAVGDYALKRINERGIGFDLEAKRAWLAEKSQEMDTLSTKLAMWGWVRGKPGIKKDFANIMDRLGIVLPLTESGMLASDADTLSKFRDHSFVDLYLKFMELEKAMSFVINNNASRLHPRYNCVLNTGRTSASSPNVQQLPRLGGIREMFIPKEGYKLLAVDYTAIELVCLAWHNQNTYGYSKMYELIDAGEDLHIAAAAEIYDIPKDRVTKEHRQLAKILNFGLGANMSHITFMDYAAGYGIKLTEDESRSLKERWKTVYPEMNRFWRVPQGDQLCHISSTGRIRNNCTYTAYLNTTFQGAAADLAKLALWNLEKAGFEIVLFCHDEVVCEVKAELAEKKLKEMETIMVNSANIVLPGIKVTAVGEILDKYKK